MGIDPEMIDQDPDLAQALAESLLIEQVERQEKQLAQQQEQEEKKKREAEEQERLRKKELERIEAEEAAKNGVPVAAQKKKFTKLKVLVGEKPVFEDIVSSRFVFKILHDRLKEGDDFTAKVLAALKDIYESI